jgi:CRP/FNR family transcriptional regulator, cyclic AMP receptor protein
MDHHVIFWHLKNSQLFSHLTDEDYKDLHLVNGFKQAKKNEVIYFSESVKRIYYLKVGTLKIISEDAHGNEVTKAILNAGDIFGEIALNENERIVDATNEFAKVASDQVSCCSFTLDDFKTILARNPELSLKYTLKVGDKIKELESKYADLIFKDAKSRLKDFLLNYAKKNGEVNDKGELVFNNTFTQHDIACLIGTTRQTVTAHLTELEKEGYLEYSRSSIKIKNRA